MRRDERGSATAYVAVWLMMLGVVMSGLCLLGAQIAAARMAQDAADQAALAAAIDGRESGVGCFRAAQLARLADVVLVSCHENTTAVGHEAIVVVQRAVVATAPGLPHKVSATARAVANSSEKTGGG